MKNQSSTHGSTQTRGARLLGLTLTALLLSLILSAAPAEAAAYPTSLVDYLSGRGQPSALADRKGYFAKRWPNETYSGTAEQNIRLLNYLVARDNAPQAALAARVVAKGADVTLKFQDVASRAVVGIESELSATSSAVSGSSAVLGKAKAGVYWFRLVGNWAHAEGTVALALRADGKLDVAMALRGSALPPNAVLKSLLSAFGAKPPTGGAVLESAMGKYGAALKDSSKIKPAMKKAWDAWSQDPNTLISGGTTTLICMSTGAFALGGVAPAAGIAGRFCAWGVIDLATDFFWEFLSQIAGVAGLSPAERTAMDNVLKAGRVLFIAAGPGAKVTGKIATIASKALKGLAILEESLEDGPLKLTLGVFVGANSKLVMFLSVARR